MSLRTKLLSVPNFLKSRDHFVRLYRNSLELHCLVIHVDEARQRFTCGEPAPECGILCISAKIEWKTDAVCRVLLRRGSLNATSDNVHFKRITVRNHHFLE